MDRSRHQRTGSPRAPEARGRRQGTDSRSGAGFTLVELLVTVAVAGILLALVYQIFVSQQRVQDIQEQVADAQQNARVGLDDLTRALTSLGAGALVDQGQVRILMAHEYEVVFNADLSSDGSKTAPPAGTLLGLASLTADDPYDRFPGSYATAPAEAYRFYLQRQGNQSILYRRMASAGTVWGQAQQVALLVANPFLDDPGTAAIEEPLFQYVGDFDGDGSVETLARVDASTSPRIAAGEPLDVVIRAINVNLITRTAHADPRYRENDGYRLFRLTTAISPRNLWDCPVVSPVPPAQTTLRAPAVVGTTTPVQFRVTRGGVPEAGRTVLFEIDPPAAPGVHNVTVTPQQTTDGAGYVTAEIQWPGACADLPDATTYTVVARTAQPPTLATPFGACAPHTARIALLVNPGEPTRLQFTDALVTIPECGWHAPAVTRYQMLDDCDRPVLAEDVEDNEFVLSVAPGGFGTVAPPVLGTLQGPSGPIDFTAAAIDYSTLNPAPTRSLMPPNPFEGKIQVRRDNPPNFELDLPIEVNPKPATLVGLTTHIPGTAYMDCPDPAGPVEDTFGVVDACGNPLWTLVGTSSQVDASLFPADPAMGTIASPGNRVDFLPDPVAIIENGGADGVFRIQYQAPTCTTGATTYRPELRLVPSWDSAQTASVPIEVRPCTDCSVRVLDATGATTTHLNRVCDAEGEILITRCDVPAGTTVEVFIERLAGSGRPSFDRNGPLDHVALPFAGPTVRTPLFIGDAQANDAFRVVAYIPDRTTFQTSGGVTCASERITVDTNCSEILISPVADNPGAVPVNPSAEDTPLCAAEGSEVFFRVKDCDQNLRDFASDDIDNTAGTSKGLIVEVLDATGLVLDTEHPILFESDVHGQRDSDSPYFQGTLVVTQNPADGVDSGFLRVPPNQIAILRATYIDPDDSTDRRCVAEALLVPPIPICLPFPVLSFGDWSGDLLAHNGDAAVAGNLLLPGPEFIEKSETAPLTTASPTDRFFNAYVGGTISIGGTEIPPARQVDQPFSAGGSGQAISQNHPNYFQNVPDTAGLLARLDYDRLKALAKARKVYWVAEPGTGLLVNPFRVDPLTQTFFRGTFEAVTRLPGPGFKSATHDGEFIFVDAPPPGVAEHTGSSIDQSDLADLPVFTVAGDYYTEGLIYVAGSVVLASGSGAKSVPVAVASSRDARYDEATTRFTRQDLPIDFAQGLGPVSAPSLTVNINGALYCDGEVRMPGGPSVYGVVAAERGARDVFGAQIWYDPRWMESQLEICSHCCGLSLSPAGPRVALGETLQLLANRAQGDVTWQSLAPQVLGVDQTGLVTTVAVGRAVVRAVDTGGCVAEVEVEVFCGLTLEVQGGTDLTPGDTATVVGTGHVGTVVWDTDNPSSIAISQNLGPTVAVTAGEIGGARLTATDGVGCSAFVDFTVNCPAGRQLLVSKQAPAPGDQITLSVSAGGVDVSGSYRFFVDGTEIPGRQFEVQGLAPFDVEAKLPNGSCPLGPLNVTPGCPTLRLAAVPNPVQVGQEVALQVFQGPDNNVTARFSFSADPPGAASITGSTLVPLVAGPISVTAVDGFGCAAGPETVTAVSP